MTSEWIFYPVGQGLFSYGRTISPYCESFSWVYDCGTLSKKENITNSIENLYRNKKEKNNQKTIDLLAISHFDADHINGIPSLLEKFNVNYILIPFIPLWKRLVIAFECGLHKNLNSDALRNIIDPLNALRNVNEDFQMILVGGNEDYELTLNADEIHLNKELNQENANKFVTEDFKYFKDFSVKKNARVLMVRSGVSIKPNDYWEFVPYNDSGLSCKANSNFIAEVEKHRDLIINNETREGAIQEKLIKKLKKLYDYNFGKSSKKRNIISLFLYSGSLSSFGSSSSERIRLSGEGFETSSHNINDSGKSGLLYTGDGYLNTDVRLNSLKNHLGHRVKNLHVLQVMHHGSKNNWFKGIPEILKPDISIFSSDPESRFNHPHKDVLVDFMRHGLTQQVDKYSGLKITGGSTLPSKGASRYSNNYSL